MSTINITNARQNLFQLVADVNVGFNPITIVNNKGKNAVLISEDEWKSIAESGKFEQEVIKLCPNVKAGDIKPNAQKEIIDFLIEYASDSGNVPSC